MAEEDWENKVVLAEEVGVVICEMKLSVKCYFFSVG